MDVAWQEVCELIDASEFSKLIVAITKEHNYGYFAHASLLAMFASDPSTVKTSLRFLPAIKSLYDFENRIFSIIEDLVTNDIIRNLKTLTDSGFANFLIAHHYYSGTGLSRNYHKATYFMHHAYELGSKLAASRLAYLYLFAKDIERDIDKGLYLLRKATTEDYALANYYYGLANIKEFPDRETNQERAKKQFSIAAKREFPSCFHYIGDICISNRRPNKAMQYFREGSLLGDPKAQYRYGRALLHGKGIQKDVQAAAKWFHQSADSYYSDGEYWSGFCKLCGIGTLRNTGKAIQLISRAALQGNLRARLHYQYIKQRKIVPVQRDEIIYHGTKECGEQNFIQLHHRIYSAWGQNKHEYIYSLLDNAANFFEHQPRDAFTFYKHNAVKGEDFSQFQIALCYYIGIEVDVDIKEFQVWLTLACDQEFSCALCLLARCYREGYVYDKDLEFAADSFRRASVQGHMEARLELFQMFAERSEGKSTDLSYYKWLQTGASNSIDIAQYLFSKLYPPLDSEDENSRNGIDWCIQAANQGLAEAQLHIAKLIQSKKIEETVIKQSVSELLCAAAEQGLPGAQYSYAMILKSKNNKESIHWLKLAADKDYKDAEYELAEHFANTQQKVDNISGIAYYWYHCAAIHGHDKARIKCSTIQEEIGKNSPAPERTGWVFPVRTRDRNLSCQETDSLQHYQSAAEMGFPGAMLSLAKGLYSKGDHAGALDWMVKAADTGMAEAQYHAGLYFQNGIGHVPDSSKAAEYLQLAADQNHLLAKELLKANRLQKLDSKQYLNFLESGAIKGQSESLYQLGLLYAEGKLVSRDNTKAVRYFRKAMMALHPGARSNFVYLYNRIASELQSDPLKLLDHYLYFAEDGYDNAQIDLALICIKGIPNDNGIPEPDLAEAINWLQQAAAQDSETAKYHLASCYAKGIGVDIDRERSIRLLLGITENVDNNSELVAKSEELLDWCYKQIKERHLQSALEWFANSPFYGKITNAKKKKNNKVLISRHLPLAGKESEGKVSGIELYSCEISRNFLENHQQIKYLGLFNPSIRNFMSFLDGIDHLDAIKTFVFIDTEHTYHPNMALEIQGFIRRHKPTLQTVVFHFVGVLPLLKWNETLPLQYFHVSDPQYKITKTEVPHIIQLLKRCKIPHIAIQGADSEETLREIVSPLSTQRKSICSYLYLDYRSTKLNASAEDEKPTVHSGTFHGTLSQILQSLSVYSGSGTYSLQRPTDYEYVLMTKLAYKDDAHLLSKPSECFFWLSVCGWSLVNFYTGTGGYRAALLINKFKRQIVLASRGTKANNFGALYDDLAGVMLNGKVEQHKAAVTFLEEIINQKVLQDIEIIPHCPPGMYGDIENRAYENGYQLSFTGHSLGGWLSEILVVEACLRGIYSFSVTFDCPGSAPMLSQIINDAKVSIDINQLDCTNYLSSPNIINMCNAQVGDVSCILSKEVYAKFKGVKQLKARKWVSSAGMLHSVNNFIKSGSEDTGQIESASVVGCWPTASLSRASAGAQACCEYLEYLNVINEEKNKLEQKDGTPFLVKSEKCDKSAEEIEKETQVTATLISSVCKRSKVVRLKYSTDNSFLLVHLLPSAQYVIRLYSKMLDKPATIEILGCMEDWKVKLWRYFIRLVWGNLKSNSTQADRVLVAPEMDVLVFINRMHQFTLSIDGQRFKSRLQEAYQKDKQSQIDSIQERFHSFAQFLFSILTDTPRLRDMLADYEDRTVPASPKTSRQRIVAQKGETIDSILTSLSIGLQSGNIPEGICFLQNDIATKYLNLLKCVVQQVTDEIAKETKLKNPCLFAIIGMGSWGKGCPLPFNNNKLLVITEKPSAGVSEYYSLFCSKLYENCIQNGILMQEEIPFGECLEMFVRHVSGESELIKITEKHLIKLCAMWDARYLCGYERLATSFKNTVSAILQSKDKLNVQPRSQQFVQAFFLYLKKEIEAYTSSTDLTLVQKSIGVRSVLLNISKIINFISLYYDISCTNPWERIKAFKRFNILSLELCDQLLCTWNTVHTIFARGQLFYKSINVQAYAPDSEPIEDQFIVKNQIEWEILVFGKNVLVPTMANSLYQFSKWLEICTSSLNPLKERPVFSKTFAHYYHQQALRYYQETMEFDWNIVHNFCTRALLHISINDNPEDSYELLEGLQTLATKSKVNSERERNIYDSFSSFIQTLMARSPNVIAQEVSMNQFEENPEQLLRELNCALIAVQNPSKKDEEDVMKIIKKKLDDICMQWVGSMGFQYSISFLSRFYYALLLIVLWSDDRVVIGSFRSFCLQLLHFHCQKIVRGCLQFCAPLWDDLFDTYSITKRNYLLDGVLDVPINNAGSRDLSKRQQEKLLELFASISTPQDEFDFENASSYIKMQYASCPLSSIVTATTDQEYKAIAITRYMKPEICEQIFQETEIFEPIPRDVPRSMRKTNKPPITVALRQNSKKVLLCTFFPDYPGMQIAIDALTRRLSGCASETTLSRLSVKRESDSIEKRYTVLFTKEFIGTRLSIPIQNNMDQFQMIEQRIGPCYYTLKIFETLLILPWNDGPENIYACPHKSPNGKSFYQLVSHFTGRAFVSPLLKATDGQEIVQLKSILFCFQRMMHKCNSEATQIILSLSPYDLLQDWLSSLQQFETLFTVASNLLDDKTVMKDSVHAIADKSGMAIESKVISSLYRRLIRMQEILSNDYQLDSPNLRHIDLLSLLEPRLAVYYTELLTLHSSAEAFLSLPTTFRKLSLKRTNGMASMNRNRILKDISPRRRSSKGDTAESDKAVRPPRPTIDRLAKSCNISEYLDGQTSFTCSEGLQQLSQMRKMFSEISERRKLLLDGKLVEALEGLNRPVTSSLSQSQGDSEKMSYFYVMEHVFTDVNWQEVIETMRRLQAYEGNLSGCNEFIQTAIQNALNLFVEVEDLQVLHLRSLPYVDDPLLRRFMVNSRDTLRVLDITGARELTSACMKIISRYSEVLDELYINQMNWTSFEGNYKFRYLRKLSMDECPQLVRVHLSLRHMPSLEYASFEDCFALKKFTHSTHSGSEGYGHLNYISFKRDDSLSFSSFSNLWKGLTDNGFKVCTSVMSMRTTQTDTQKTCCIKIDECLTVFSESRKKKTPAAVFVHANKPSKMY